MPSYGKDAVAAWLAIGKETAQEAGAVLLLFVLLLFTMLSCESTALNTQYGRRKRTAAVLPQVRLEALGPYHFLFALSGMALATGIWITPIR